MGILVGVAIGAYDWVINELLWSHVTRCRLVVQMWAPLAAMVAAGLLLRLFRVPSSSMADEVVNAYHQREAAMPAKTAWGKLVASVATMGLGASAGMEGASKWLGATIGSVLQTALNRLPFRATRGDVKTTLISGGSAGIAAIFRAPLSGAIMGVESPYKHDLAHEALVHALVASATSFWAYTRLRPATPYFPVTFHYVLTTKDLLVALPLGLCAGAASHLFLWTLRYWRRRFGNLPGPLPLRMAAAGALLVLIAFAGYWTLGRPVTLQAGLPVANLLLNGGFGLRAALLVFVLKLLATTITFGGGGVGGLFVPTATIGAALGACFDQIFAASHPGVFTLLGIAAFAGASYNSILFSAVFVAEATGNVFLVVPALIASSFAFLVSAGVSNSRAQRARRPGWRDALAKIPVEQLMVTRIVTASPSQTLESFAHSVLVTHQFKALPVIDEKGVLLAMVSVGHLRSVARNDWARVIVSDVMDRSVRTICPEQSAADADATFNQTPYDYIPVVDPRTYQLIGILSHSDVYRSLDTKPSRYAA
ncbi:MAG TPA: chloride channel protein [Polyangia bacterium]|nr:chloride channel protein [Polyangia bacterium]